MSDGPYSRAFQTQAQVSAMTQQPTRVTAEVLIQADPANAVDGLFALNSEHNGHVLPAGASVSLEVTNLDMVYLGSSDGATVVRFTITGADC